MKKTVTLFLIFSILSSLSLLWAQETSSSDTKSGKEKESFLSEIENGPHKVKLLAVPGPFYNPNIGYGVTLLPMLMYKVDPEDSISPPSTTAGMFLWSKPTEKISGSTFAGGLQQKLYLKNDTWRLRGYLGYAKVLQKFYNAGNTGTDNQNAWVWNQGLYLGVSADRKIYKRVYAGLGYDLQRYELYGFDDTGSLFLQNSGIPTGNQSVSSFSAQTYIDTRNSQFGSTSGIYTELSGTYGAKWLGGDTTYGQISLDYSQYLKLNWHPGQTLAWKVNSTTGVGTLTNNTLSSIGGRGGLRGYMNGEYKDKSALEAQIEYRGTIYKKLGMAAFFGFGTTYGSTNFADGPWLPSGGFGLRFLLEEKQNLNARLDFAWGRDSFALYFALGEAF